MKEIMTIFSLPVGISVFLIYVIFIASKHKALVSVSESDYWLKYPFKWTFEATMFFLSLSIIYVSINLREVIFWPLFTSGVGIAGVGLFSRFKKNLFFKVSHYLSAFTGYISLFACFLWMELPWVGLIPLIIGIMVYIKMKTQDSGTLIWWLEIILAWFLFLCIYFNILIEII